MNRNRAPAYDCPKVSAAEKIAAALEIPPDYVGVSHIEMAGSRRILIEGAVRVLSYDENVICLDLKKTHIAVL